MKNVTINMFFFNIDFGMFYIKEVYETATYTSKLITLEILLKVMMKLNIIF